MSPDPEVALEYIQQHRELGEDEDPVPGVPQLRQQVVQQGKLTAETFEGSRSRSRSRSKSKSKSNSKSKSKCMILVMVMVMVMVMV